MFKGKAIYNPSGKAGEYSYWVCNFHKGCSNGCIYCYLKKGVLAHAMGGNKAELKSCFKNEDHAIEVFEKELKQNLADLQVRGLFFTFTSDPMLPDTIKLTERAIDIATDWDVPVKILTKRADFLDYLLPRLPINLHNRYAFGFTLTGHDELEPGASTNIDRIKAMKELHELGFKTFASIEPIIDFESSLKMIRQTIGICDLYKIGLESGKKYDKNEMLNFASRMIPNYIKDSAKVYFKDSILSTLGWNRADLPENFVNRDYNMFQ